MYKLSSSTLFIFNALKLQVQKGRLLFINNFLFEVILIINLSVEIINISIYKFIHFTTIHKYHLSRSEENKVLD